MSRVLQNFSINLHTWILFLNSFIRSRLVYSCQNWNLNSNQMNRLDVVYQTFLCKMVRGGFKCIDETGNDYRLQISNAHLHDICHTSNVSNFVRCQKFNYTALVVRMPPSRTQQNCLCLMTIIIQRKVVPWKLWWIKWLKTKIWIWIVFVPLPWARN